MIVFSGSAMSAKHISTTKKDLTVMLRSIFAEAVVMKTILHLKISKELAPIAEKCFPTRTRLFERTADKLAERKQSNGSLPQVKLRQVLPL